MWVYFVLFLPPSFWIFARWNLLSTWKCCAFPHFKRKKNLKPKIITHQPIFKATYHVLASTMTDFRWEKKETVFNINRTSEYYTWFFLRYQRPTDDRKPCKYVDNQIQKTKTKRNKIKPYTLFVLWTEFKTCFFLSLSLSFSFRRFKPKWNENTK